MRKIFSLLAILVLLLSSSNSFASVGVRLNGTTVGAATDLNFVCGSGTNGSITADGAIYNVNCSSTLQTTGVANGGAVSMATSDLAVPTSYAFVRKAIAALAAGSFSAGTLANGIPGQVLTVFVTTVGASGTYTITPVTKTGVASVTLTAANDEVIFLYVNDTVGWVLLSYDGSVTVTKTAT